MYSPIDDDVEWGGKPIREPTYEFAERTVRNGFVRKVLGLLTVQLGITAVTGAAFMLSPSIKGFVSTNPWTLLTAFFVSLALVLVLACSETARRSHPTNLILLFAFTTAEAVLVGAACATYSATVVVIAVIITAAVVAGMALFACQSKVDLTSMGGVLYSLVIVLIVASVIQAFVHLPWLHLAICSGGAALFSIYLIFDLQLIMGNGDLSLSPDEYVLATLNIYLDVLNIFLYILQLVNSLTKNN